MNDEQRPLIFGEALFDVMPDGSCVLGGSPFNVAWHLQAFGLRSLMVTRVGDDEPGVEVLAAMTSWGMDISGGQRDDVSPTGQVQVELVGGEPTFHILPDQAYDHLDVGQVVNLVSAGMFSLMYHARDPEFAR